MLRRFLSVFFLICGTSFSVMGKLPPNDNIEHLCEEADLIIEGTAGKGQKVHIITIHKPSEYFRTADDIIRVQGIDKLDKFLYKREGGKVIKETDVATNKVILFLNFDKATAEWSFHPVGVIWYDDVHFYRYQLVRTSSPYFLNQAGEVKSVRAELKEGLEISKKWHEILAIEDPQKKAEAFADYLRTRPGKSRSHLHSVGTEVKKLGAVAVQPIIKVLSDANPADNLSETVNAINALGPLASDALPLLSKLLKTPGKTPVSVTFVALKSLNDRRAISDFRDMLQHKDEVMRTVAATTLAEFDDVESAKDILKILPAEWTLDNLYHVRDRLNAIWYLNPQLAEPLMKKAEADPDLAEIKDQLRRWDRKPPRKPPTKPPPKPPEEKF